MTVNFGIAGIAKQTHKEPMTLGKKEINGLFSPVFAAFCKNIKVCHWTFCLHANKNRLVFGGRTSPLIGEVSFPNRIGLTVPLMTSQMADLYRCVKRGESRRAD